MKPLNFDLISAAISGAADGAVIGTGFGFLASIVLAVLGTFLIIAAVISKQHHTKIGA